MNDPRLGKDNDTVNDPRLTRDKDNGIEHDPRLTRDEDNITANDLKTHEG